MSLVFDDRNIASFHLPISLFEIFRSLTSSILILEIIFNVQFSRYHITCFASYFEKSLRDSRYFYRNASPLSVFLNRNSFISIQWRQRDSNSRPPACKAGALPTELCPLTGNYAIVGALFWLSPSASGFHPMGLSGLEPPTSRLSGVRSNQLSYKPIRFLWLLMESGSHLLSHTVSSIVPSAA